MAFRGRGRGRGYGGGGGFRVAKQEPFILFPDISENLTDAKTVNEEVNLAIYGSRLQKFWNSLYYFNEEKTEKDQSFDIKRLFDLGKKRGIPNKELPNTIFRTSEYVPAELARVSKLEQRGQKKVRWNPESALQRLDIFEKLEQKHQGQVEKGGKEGDEEEEDDERVEDEDKEFSDDGDYNQVYKETLALTPPY
ncbi:unnamed protein product [Ilex paraguariensis]|uniref:Uncharacterized protein n=1 Tax=Ilex paraguariensis TaxID=185542 RepID=A0ABC8T4Y7_9AQUA